uniref:Uncharacterized protein n=1 Tax=Anguilla anguilla TaxID=7936 RepID=A0A0E9X9L6_ANGAN
MILCHQSTHGHISSRCLRFVKFKNIDIVLNVCSAYRARTTSLHSKTRRPT